MEAFDDNGIVLSARAYGDSSAVLNILCEHQGRHAGMLRGASSSRQRGIREPGTRVHARWQARLSDHLGNWSLEATRYHAAELLDQPLRLSGLQAVCSLADAALPEREAHADVYYATEALLDAMEGEFWAAVLVMWEVKLLKSLGFGLDLSRCAVTGDSANLTYVSPKSGCAVSAEGAGPYKERLLSLPGFLIGQGMAEPSDIVAGLRLTGHFLQRHVFDVTNKPLPPARLRFAETYSRFAGPPATVKTSDDDSAQ
ncbi:MAG: DNA repair protein RecO [Pseudomonadota bacterium]